MLGPRARVTAAPSLRGHKCVGGDHRELSVEIRCCGCEDVTHCALRARIHIENPVTRIMAEQTESGSENIVSNLSDKSRSLRKTSVKKRLETEMKKVTKKRKEKYPKKPRLNKYQRKVANAKERERMKQSERREQTERQPNRNGSKREQSEATSTTKRGQAGLCVPPDPPRGHR